jgi:hypothetical protein
MDDGFSSVENESRGAARDGRTNARTMTAMESSLEQDFIRSVFSGGVLAPKRKANDEHRYSDGNRASRRDCGVVVGHQILNGRDQKQNPADYEKHSPGSEQIAHFGLG